MAETVIKCENVYKIFGSNPKKMLQESIGDVGFCRWTWKKLDNEVPLPQVHWSINGNDRRYGSTLISRILEGLPIWRGHDATILGLPSKDSRWGVCEGRQDWYWNCFFIWAPDEIWSLRWISCSDHKKSPLAQCYSWAPLVPFRRN